MRMHRCPPRWGSQDGAGAPSCDKQTNDAAPRACRLRLGAAIAPARRYTDATHHSIEIAFERHAQNRAAKVAMLPSQRRTSLGLPSLPSDGPLKLCGPCEAGVALAMLPSLPSDGPI